MGGFGDRLRSVRKERGLTLDRLATKCGSSMQVLRNYEKSRKSPNIEMFLRICEALETSLDYLLQDELSFNPFEEKADRTEFINGLSTTQINLLKQLFASIKNNTTKE